MKRKNPTCSSWGHTCDPTSASTKTCIKTQEQQKSNMITLCMFLTSLVFIVDASSSSSDSLNKVSSRLQVQVRHTSTRTYLNCPFCFQYVSCFVTRIHFACNSCYHKFLGDVGYYLSKYSMRLLRMRNSL